MDPVKRAPARLRRFYEFKRRELGADQLSGMTTRSLAAQTHQSSLRALMDASLVSLVPPVLPLTDGLVTCTHALAAFGSSGRFQLGARLETASDAPTLFFIIGFCTNNDEGRWSFLPGALNYGEETPYTSRSPVGAFSVEGGSTWLRENYAEAVSRGVTFRLYSSADLAMNVPTHHIPAWIKKFNGDPHPSRIMSLTDTLKQSWGPQFETSSPNVSAVEGDDDGTLSFGASLVFE